MCVNYGGQLAPGIIVSKNKKKRTAFVKFFSESVLDMKKKQLVNFDEIFYFGSDDQHEAIIQDDPTLRKKFELAEKSLNLMQ